MQGVPKMDYNITFSLMNFFGSPILDIHCKKLQCSNYGYSHNSDFRKIMFLQEIDLVLIMISQKKLDTRETYSMSYIQEICPICRDF